jgi:predicted component of type VI protein secretion system
MLQAELKILGGKHLGKLIPLNVKKFLVGREQDCHLRPNSDLVSRHHCVFSIDDYAVRLRDLGSTNGTQVNGKNIRGEVILKAGDQISIGKLDLEMVIRHTFAKPAEGKPIPPIAEPLSVAEVSETPTPTGEVETSYELAVYPTAQPEEPMPQVPADTAIIGSPPPQYPQQPIPAYPPGYPQMVPPGYPMPGGYMPPQYPQYPQYPPAGYGQPPGYGQPMGYPMGYPQMMPMQPGYPGVAVAAPAAPAIVETPPEAAAPDDDELAVRLPKPEETGAKPTLPPVGSGGSGGGPAAEKPSTTAADIIKQYMSKRS